MNIYQRNILGVEIDVYDIQDAYGVGHPEAHAIKKLLLSGDRGYKDKIQDLTEAKKSIDRAITMAIRKKGNFSEDLRGPDHE